MGNIIGAGDQKEEITLLDIGDKVEVGISTLYRAPGVETWIKVGVVLTKRSDESDGDAFDRGIIFCSNSIAETIEEM